MSTLTTEQGTFVIDEAWEVLGLEKISRTISKTYNEYLLNGVQLYTAPPDVAKTNLYKVPFFNISLNDLEETTKKLPIIFKYEPNELRYQVGTERNQEIKWVYILKKPDPLINPPLKSPQIIKVVSTAITVFLLTGKNILQAGTLCSERVTGFGKSRSQIAVVGKVIQEKITDCLKIKIFVIRSKDYDTGKYRLKIY